MAIEDVGPGGVSRSGGVRTVNPIGTGDSQVGSPDGYVYYDIDTSGNTVLMMADQPIQLLGRGSNIVAVSSVAEIVQAIADLTPMTTRLAQTAVITINNGSATLTGEGTGWATTGTIPGVGDLWKPDAGSRYYKIKAVNSDTSITLWEPYQGATITAVSTAFKFYYLNRYNLVMAPGEYSVTGASPIVLQPGFDFTALDPHATSINEGQSDPSSPFSNLSDNNFTNIRWAPTTNFGAMDGMFGATGFPAIKADLWAGASAKFTGCIVHSGNPRNIHSGGGTRMPVLAGGLTEYEACEFLHDHAGMFVTGGGITQTNANTEVIMNDCIHRKVPGAGGSLIYQQLLCFADAAGSLLGTFHINNPTLIYPDLALNPILGSAAGFGVLRPVVVNISGAKALIANTSGSTPITCGVDVQAAATVNISRSDIEASGTGATGVNIGDVAATVNIRSGSRINGSTNSINAGTGSTVNVSGNADLIGATAGAGVINLTTAT